jgi:AraC-like DNA-binding protein
MSAEFEYLRAGSGIPDSQLLSINSAEGFCIFRIQTLHLGELPSHSPHKVPVQHAHNVFHLVFYPNDNNRNGILLNDKEVETLPGTLVATSPGEPHSFQAMKSGITVYHELTFSIGNVAGVFCGNWNELMRYYSGVDNVNIPAVTLLDDAGMAILDKHFRDLGGKLKNLQDSMLPAFKVVMSMLEFLFSEVYMAKDSARQDDVMARVKLFIEKKFSNDLNLKDLGRHFFMSPEHLCRKYKEAYGISPLKYAIELKISTAKNMLSHSEYTIKDISDRLGFSDVYAFSQSFKKNTGIPPGKYRQSG